MGNGVFATNLNCHTKIKLGWINEDKYIKIPLEDVEKTIELNPYNDRDSNTQCIVIDSPLFNVGENVDSRNELVIEYRSKEEGISDSLPDVYLDWLTDGSPILERYSNLRSVNT